MKYEKPAISIEDQLSILEKERGLIIKDQDKAKKYLKNIGYFRLSGYMFHLQIKDGTHLFKDGTEFNQIIRHYKFDQQLRILFLIYLERIEVKLRASLTNEFSINHGFFWYQNIELFANTEIHESICFEIKQNYDNAKERFLKSYKNKYTTEDYPPSNMALEILTFGKLAKLYKGLKNNTEKMAIAKSFGLPSSILTSWLIYLNNVRNVCAHYGRLWNRRITADQPVIPSRKKNRFNGELPRNFNTTAFGMISLINKLLDSFNPQNKFIYNVISLIDEYSDIIDVKYMGFTENWKEEPPWK